MSTATAERLWINQGGMVVCDAHGGNYLRSAIEGSPTAETHLTPLDSWERIQAGLVHEGWALTCEMCPRDRKGMGS